MKLLKNAVLQGIVLVALALVVGFLYNAKSRNKIDPFNQPARIPVTADSLAAGGEIFRVIDLEEARAFVESGGRVVDARMRDAYVEGHIPGALLFDYYDMGRYRDAVLPLLSAEEPIMVYCSELTCEDSEMLARELRELGYRKLLVFKGGWAEWSGAGLPADTGE